MNVREAITEGKSIYRVSIATGSGLSFLLTSELRKDANFIKTTADDFSYSVEGFKDKGKIKSIASGDFLKTEKYLNLNNVISYEEIPVGDSRHEGMKEIIDRCLAAGSNIELPEKKTIEIVR